MTSRIDRAVDLFTEVASGRLDQKSISDEVDALLGLLGRLDRAERWQEALRVARCLSVLLALIARWIELLRSLRIALHAAEQLGDPFGEAWALHELGTLHLAAGRHADADRLLGRAREIRERCGDRRGLAITDRNLQVLCRALRNLLHPRAPARAFEMIVRRPALALIAAAALLAAGGTAGAVVAGSGSPPGPGFHPASVAFSFTPSSPHVGQRVVFRATATDPQDPVASYTWQWGDGDPARAKIREHAYRKAGRYRVVLTVRDARGRRTGRDTRWVIVQRPPVRGPNAEFSFQPRSPTVGTRVIFDARSSFDPRAAITRYEWSFGDGERREGVKAEHTYTTAGTHEISLTVTDRQRQSNKLVQAVAVTSGQGRQRTEIRLSCPPSSVLLGEAVKVSGSITPRRPGATITVTYTGPHSTPREPVTSHATGTYESSTKPEEAESWSVQSSLPGDSRYLPSTSEACPFWVERRTDEKPVEERAKEAEARLLKDKERQEGKAAAARARQELAKKEQAKKEAQEEEQRRERESEPAEKAKTGATTEASSPFEPPR